MPALLRAAHAVLDDDARFRLHCWLTSCRLTRTAYGAARPELGGLAVGPHTDLVIEGFPRSANTYAVAAFRCANGGAAVLADHLHVAASVVAGVRRGLPVIVVVREPVEAVASLVQRQPMRPETALRAYVRFYARIQRVLPEVVVSDFPVTITAFGSVIEAVNRRHGTAYRPYELTPANERWCREFVLDADVRDQGQLRIETVALPQAARAEQRRPIVESVLAHRDLVDRARDLYAEVRAVAVIPC